MADKLPGLLTQFAERWTLSPPDADARGQYRLRLDDRLEIALFETGNQIFLEAILGVLPSDERQYEERLAGLMRGWLAELGTAAEVLTLDPERRAPLLFRRLPAATLTLNGLEQALETFANRLEFWTRALDGGAAPSPPPPAAGLPYLVFP